METISKEEELAIYYEKYGHLIERKNGIYYYPETLPELLKNDLKAANDVRKSFPEWHSKKRRNVVRISEEEMRKDLENLESLPKETEFD